MNHMKIQEVLRKHQLWLSGDEGGVRADFMGTYLIGGNFEGANLEEANFSYTYLYKSNFKNANLMGVDFRYAKIEGANLEGAKFSPFLICPETGSFQAYKKTTKGIIKVSVPARANRLNAITSRKIRVSEFKVLGGPGVGGTGTHYPGLIYEKGQTYKAPRFNDDIRLECAEGLHVFLTEQEAEEW